VTDAELRSKIREPMASGDLPDEPPVVLHAGDGLSMLRDPRVRCLICGEPDSVVAYFWTGGRCGEPARGLRRGVEAGTEDFSTGGAMTRRWLCIMVALCASWAVVAPASAQFYDGNKLVEHLREFERGERSDPNSNYYAGGIYVGYVLGVFDTINSSLCRSGNVSVRLPLVVAKYLNEHPEQWSQPASVLVTRALRGAFPCK